MEETDVLVIGAGLAGLSAARVLASGVRRVVVLEARDRVGGRTLTEHVGGAMVDLGGQWIGPGQNRMIALAKKLGVETYPTWTTGRKVMDLDGKLSSYKGSIPSLGFFDLIRLHRVLGRVDKTALSDDLDGLTVEAWKQQAVGSRVVRGLIDVAVRSIFGAECGELSLLYFLTYVKAAGGLRPLIETEGGAQQDRFVLGAQEISRRLADGIDVRFGAAVRKVVQESDVRVVSDAGEWRAKRVICAIPPVLAQRIVWEPALPAERDQFFQRMPMGATVKCVALYERPFWRDAGMAGEAVSTTGPVTAVFDNGPRDGSGGGSLLAFVVGRAARGWAARSEGDRRATVLGAFTRYFGERAANPVGYVEKDWQTEVWTRGCPVGAAAPGALAAFGHVMRAPVGRVHFAGTETALEWMGYMEGAVESGERVGREVVGALV